MFSDTQASHNELQNKVENMEMELAEKRLLYSENINIDSDDDDGMLFSSILEFYGNHEIADQSIY